MTSTKQMSGKVKSQDEFTSPFAKVKLFRKKKMAGDDMFGVEFEESREISSDSLSINQPINILTQKSDDTISEKDVMKKKASLFSQKKNTIDAFNVSFEMSTNLTQATLASSILSKDKSETLSQNITTKIKRPELFKNVGKVRNSFSSSFDEFSQSQTISQKSDDYKEILSQDSANSSKCKLFNQKRKNNDNNFDMDFEKSQTSSQESTKSSQQSQGLLSDDSTYFTKPKLFKSKKGKRNIASSLDFEKPEQKLNEDLSQHSQEIQSLSVVSQKDDEPLSQNIEKPKLFKTREKPSKDPFDIDFEESNQCLSIEGSQNGNVTNVNKLIPFNSQRKHKDDPFNIDFEESKTFNETCSTPPIQRRTPFKPVNKGTDENYDVNFDYTNFGDSITVARSQNLFKRKESSQDFQISMNGTVDESESVIDPKRECSHTSLHKEEFEELPREKEPNFEECKPEKSITDVKHLEYLTENTKAMIDGNIPEVPSFLNESSFNDENLNAWMSDHSEVEPEDVAEDVPEDVPDTDSPKAPPSPIPNDSGDDALEDADNLEDEFQLKLNDIINNARKIARKDRSVIISKPQKVEQPKRDKDKFRNLNEYKKPRLAKPARFANKRLYEYVIKKIKPKYGLDYVLKAEEIVVAICDVVKIVNRRKTYQKKLVNNLKLDMAKMGLIETTFDFHEFVRNYLPYEFREKVVPCIQPGSNIIYPPRDAKNPFDKILP